MNVVNELSKCIVDKYEEKWCNFLSILKINKKIKILSNQLKNEDIFKLSDYIVSFLNGIPSYILEICDIHLYKSNLSMEINESSINYNAILREVSIYDKKDKLYYSIQKKSILPSYLIKKWDNLDEEIKNFYIEIITDVSYELVYKYYPLEV